jgi:para-aminobenzoate synthetase component 1
VSAGEPATLVARFGLRPGDTWLDSAGPHGPVARWSFLALDPVEVVRLDARDAAVEGARPFAALAALQAVHPPGRFDPSAGPWPLVTCALAYDLGRLIECVPSLALDDVDLPLLWAARYEAVYVYDHLSGRGEVVGAEPAAVEALARRVESAATHPPRAAHFAAGPVECASSETGHAESVRRIRGLIQAGDVYQVNLTTRFSAPRAPDADPVALFERLRTRSPAPFGACFRLDPDRVVASISPERFLRWWPDGRVETRPIKGTRPRGRSPEEDFALADALRHSEKDLAEHVMIVDLERNDLGRVCTPGSVRVASAWGLESHPTVHHLVSVVEGRLSPEVGLEDLLHATFPGGSITGAPKVRAMQTIEALEPSRRGLYCGALGYLDAAGGGDLNLAIRTAWTDATRVYYQAGGGIVWDSDAAEEWAEAWTKARAFVDVCAGR